MDELSQQRARALLSEMRDVAEELARLRPLKERFDQLEERHTQIEEEIELLVSGDLRWLLGELVR